MRTKAPPELERFREKHPNFGATPTGSMWGYFLVGFPTGEVLKVISSGGADNEWSGGWEHVSISPYGQERCPTWEEMCAVKNLFWRGDECVIQFHPPHADYINHNPFVLHLWKPPYAVPLPPSEQV